MRPMIKQTGISSLIAVAAAVALAAPAVAHPLTLPSNFSMTGKTPPPSGPAPVPDSPIADPNTPTPPVLSDVTSYVLMDARTGAIIAEAAPDLQVAPASLTKLMTAHIVYQAVKNGSLTMNQTVPVSVAAWHTGGSRMFINPNTHVTVDQLLHGLIVDSGNDAAVALAQAVAGTQSSFVQLMNRDAGQLGLTDTNYTDVDGLPDPALHTSALDVAKLSRAILQDEPQILNISKLPSYAYDNITQTSWNPVLAVDPTVDGLKTGLTNESGHCIDATAVRGDMRLIAVVMGGPSWQASTAAIEIPARLWPEILHGCGHLHGRPADRHAAQRGAEYRHGPGRRRQQHQHDRALRRRLQGRLQNHLYGGPDAGRDQGRNAGHGHLHAGRQNAGQQPGDRADRCPAREPSHQTEAETEQIYMSDTPPRPSLHRPEQPVF